MFATFMMAFVTGKRVTIYGTETCAHGNSEEVLTLYVSD